MAVYLAAGVIKNNDVETVVVCMNLAPAPLDVGLEVVAETGAHVRVVARGPRYEPDFGTITMQACERFAPLFGHLAARRTAGHPHEVARALLAPWSLSSDVSSRR